MGKFVQRERLAWLAIGLLAVTCTVLAALQYRWTGEIAGAQRGQLRDELQFFAQLRGRIGVAAGGARSRRFAEPAGGLDCDPHERTLPVVTDASWALRSSPAPENRRHPICGGMPKVFWRTRPPIA